MVGNVIGASVRKVTIGATLLAMFLGSGCGASGRAHGGSSTAPSTPPPSSPPASVISPPAPTDPGAAPVAVGFSANGQPVYGGLGPEGVPLEIATSLGTINPAPTGQTIAGVACNSTEQLSSHHHAHLAIFVNGQGRSLPLGIGIAPVLGVQPTPRGDFASSSSTCFYWLHVHATDGIIHIESPTEQVFTLGQVFAVYGQPLSSTQVGAGTGTVTATVNGQSHAGSPADIPLGQHDQVVLNVGGPIVTPPPIVWPNSSL